MCKSMAQGGQRCASHTRERLQKAAQGVEAAAGTGDLTALRAAQGEWEEAAAEYASTDEGHGHLAAQAAHADAAGDLDTAALLNTVVRRGEALRAANRETAALIKAVRLSQQAVAPSPLPEVSTAGSDVALVEPVDRPVVPDLEAKDRAAWAKHVKGLRALTGRVADVGGTKPEEILDAMEGLDATLGDPAADDDAVAQALAAHDAIFWACATRMPTTKVMAAIPITNTGRRPLAPREHVRHETTLDDWKAWQSAAHDAYPAQYARAAEHPAAGEQTYRFLLDRRPSLTRRITARPTCPAPTLNAAMRATDDTESDSTKSVHPDGWSRARDLRMGDPALALTLAAKDPDTWQRHEALNQVIMTPMHDFSRHDREWMVTNLHLIPGPENQAILARSLVSFAKAYADDDEKATLRDLFTQDSARINRPTGGFRVIANRLGPELREIGAQIGTPQVPVSLERKEPKKRGLFARG